ncbi:actin cytoskeleton-regulatory complex protein SLA1-like [Ostrinia furnacalis]|uniref:actin cytoskeleton-regulatory complex protein SLA1-like n=1 Tax=Ostrinia furnacalis TaxID=93504 RepID=UPI001039C6D1|nr:actin cytoskeleton-regulatory complex protein SLA1-like [Ostrinia furnacalis]
MSDVICDLSKSNVNVMKSDVIPSLPKPKSSVSPKLGRSTPTNTVQAEPSKPSNGSADLLGLDSAKPDPKPANNDDIFSSFFSAPQEKPAEVKLEDSKADLKVEEENFFKQAAPTEKEKSKLTKDSILALYSQTPSTNLVNQFNPAPAQPAYQGFGYQQPFNTMPAQNGMQFNQFQPMNNQFQQPFAPPTQQPLPNQQFPQTNQFFSGQQPQQPLTQQFGGLNLGQSFPNFAQTNSNVASNTTWQ